MWKTTVTFLWLALVAAAAGAQERLTVGLIERPPFAMRTEDGAWTGMAVDLWRMLAEDAGIAYEYVAVDGADALDATGVDLVLPVYASPELSERYALSQPFYTATLGVASPVQGRVMAVVRGFASWQFARLVLGLSALLLVVGALIWLLERGRNEDQFARHPVRGLGDGFWWAGVTLTTIGYGDKAPKTLVGRTVAMLWMLVGLAVSAALTASVVALSGLHREVDAPEAFAEAQVGAVRDTTAALFLAHENVDLRLFEDVPAALAALDRDEVDMVAAAAPTLRHVVQETGAFDFTIRTTQLDPHYVAMALPARSGLLPTLDTALLRRLTAESGWNVIERYLPE